MPTIHTYLDPGTAVDPDVRKICAEVVHHFPAIPNVWGYSSASSSDHRNRRCIDYMVIGQKTDAARLKLGNDIAAYHKADATRLGVNGQIWNHQVMGFPHVTNPAYRGPYGTWRKYFGGNQHTDHVHVEYDGSTYQPDTPPKPYVWDGHSFPGTGRFKIGSKGPWVTRLGEMLVEVGYRGYKEGPGPLFTEADRRAVQWYQKRTPALSGDADGFPGPVTWSLLVAATADHTYTVKSGDSLSQIGLRVGVAWREIAAANKLKAPYVVKPGQVLRLPR